MSLDIDIIKARANNEYRLSKVRGEAMISVRIPGGIMPAHLLAVAQQIAEQYGNGLIHLTTRQKLAMPGIKYRDMDKVNAALEPFIKEIEVETCSIEIADTKVGYQSIGGRNIVACQGNTICQKGNIDCTGLAQRMEKHLYPNPYHLKMVIAGCPNDCAKANMADFGIFGIAKIHFKAERCIGCGACIKACSHHAVDCLTIKHGKAVKEKSKCIGCGECVLACPTLGQQYADVLARHNIAVEARDVEAAIPLVWQELACSASPARDRFVHHPKGARGFWRHFVERTCELIDAPRPSAFAAAELFDRFARPEAWEVAPGTRPMLAELKRRGVLSDTVDIESEVAASDADDPTGAGDTADPDEGTS